jgi:hypothetical protein
MSRLGTMLVLAASLACCGCCDDDWGWSDGYDMDWIMGFGCNQPIEPTLDLPILIHPTEAVG